MRTQYDVTESSTVVRVQLDTDLGYISLKTRAIYEDEFDGIFMSAGNLSVDGMLAFVKASEQLIGCYDVYATVEARLGFAFPVA